MYEHRNRPLLSRAKFVARIARHLLLALLLIGIALGIGVLGYHYLGELSWIDSLLNASMILSGMGPVDPMRTKYLTITTRAAEEGEKLAQVSGGVFYSIKRLDDLQKAYNDIVLQMRTAYTITYNSNADNTGHRRLRVRTNREGASVRLSPAVTVPH